MIHVYVSLVMTYSFIKRGKELNVGLELLSSLFKCFVIWEYGKKHICIKKEREGIF